MDDTEILDGIRTVARIHLQFEGPLGADTPLVEALRLDSLRLLTLVAELENHFQVILEPEDEASLATVGDLIQVLRSRIE